MKLEGNKGDRVKAVGVDTRGHQVTRIGTMLWDARQVKAQRSGKRVDAWRVFVGEPGDDPTVRATWVTLFEDEGSVEWLDAPPVEAGSPKWEKRKMGDLVSWEDVPRYFRYGGLAKHKAGADGPMVRVRFAESRFGMNNLVDVHTNEVVDRVHSMSMVWVIRATDEEMATMPPLVKLPDARPDYSLPPEERQADDVQDDEPKPRKAFRPGVLFEGWVTKDRSGPGFIVMSMDHRRQIGWLTSDHRFVPVGG